MNGTLASAAQLLDRRLLAVDSRGLEGSIPCGRRVHRPPLLDDEAGAVCDQPASRDAEPPGTAVYLAEELVRQRDRDLHAMSMTIHTPIRQPKETRRADSLSSDPGYREAARSAAEVRPRGSLLSPKVFSVSPSRLAHCSCECGGGVQGGIVGYSLWIGTTGIPVSHM